MNNENKKLITKEGFEELEKTLYHLKYVDMPRVIADISEGREHGDLKENAEYQTAKEEQFQLNAKIANTEMMLSTSKIKELSDIPDKTKVDFGCYVTLLNLETEINLSFRVVGEYESDFSKGKVSITSPLARAIIGKSKGDEASVKLPNGEEDYEVIDIKY